MKKILIIDDEEDLLRVLGRKLQSQNYEIRTASDAIMAVKEAHEFRPHLIILDMMMPAGGGTTALRNIKMSNFLKTIPIIVLTALDDETKKAEMKKMGVDDYITKPYDFDKLNQIIINLIDGAP